MRKSRFRRTDSESGKEGSRSRGFRVRMVGSFNVTDRIGIPSVQRPEAVRAVPPTNHDLSLWAGRSWRARTADKRLPGGRGEDADRRPAERVAALDVRPGMALGVDGVLQHGHQGAVGDR